MIQDIQGAPVSLQSQQAISATGEREQFGQSSPVSLTFIDSAVDDIDTLISQVEQGAQVIVLDSQRDGISQITEALASYDDVASLNIVSHGQAGELQLGSTTIDSDDLASYSSQFQQWQNVLTEDADILFYGCNVAAGQRGMNFLERLSNLTGADIAGSDNLTGNSDLGGDWQLEFATGDIEASSPFQNSVGEVYGSVFERGSTIFSGNPSQIIQESRRDSNTRHGVTVADNPAGPGEVLRFELRRNDPISSNRHRAELVPRHREEIEFGQSYTYSFRNYFPRDYVRDDSGETIAQWHGRPDRNLGESNRRAPAAIRIENGRFVLRQRFDSDRVTNTRQAGGFTERRFNLGEVEHGRWIDWRLEVRWSHQGDGVFRLYKDNELVVNRSGANTYNDRIAPFAKLGVYKPDWTVRPQNSSINRRVYFAADYTIREGFGGNNSQPVRSQSVLAPQQNQNNNSNRNTSSASSRSNQNNNNGNNGPGSGRIRIEAESLQLNGYRIEQNSAGSGRRVVGLGNRGNRKQGRATYVHRGGTGRFNLDLNYFDESDGTGQVQVQLNGRTIERFTLNSRSGSASPNAQSRRSRTIDGLNLSSGDRITIIGNGRGGEGVRLDYLELNPISGAAASNNSNNQRRGGGNGNRFERTLQAEDARLINVLNFRGSRNIQEGRFVRFQQVKTGAIEFTVNVPEAGDYRLDFLYAQGQNVSRSPIDLLINGRRENSAPRFGHTGGPTNYRLAGDTVSLRTGRNKIRLQSTGRTQANFDSLRVRAA